jgi:hypothetical protein
MIRGGPSCERSRLFHTLKSPEKNVKTIQACLLLTLFVAAAPGSWMQRLKRVFAIDIETCPECGGKLRVIACIEDPPLIEKILGHVHQREALSTNTPRSPPVLQPELTLT